MFVSFNYTSANQVSYAVVKDGAGIHQRRRPRRCTASGPNLLGFGRDVPGCTDLLCTKQVNRFNYGLGIIRSGSWLMQIPMFAGYSATEAYLPSKKIAIAVAVTFDPQAFNPQGTEPNSSTQLFQAIGACLAPHDAPPAQK
jgi:hypothetical protein